MQKPLIAPHFGQYVLTTPHGNAVFCRSNWYYTKEKYMPLGILLFTHSLINT